MTKGRRRLSVDLDDDAREGWEAMGRHTGGNLTAIANVLGRRMKAALEGGWNPAWQQLAEEISNESWERRSRS